MAEKYKLQHDIARSYEERNERIMQDRAKGMTLKEIANKYYLSTERVRMICKKAVSRNENP